MSAFHGTRRHSRWMPRSGYVALLVASLAACRAYDADRLTPEAAPDGAPRQQAGAAAGNGLDAGDSSQHDPRDAMRCSTGAVETCNRMDDDCDGAVDEDAVSCLPHASTLCISGVCVLQECDPGACNCNGSPNDGCETPITEAPDVCHMRCTPIRADAGEANATDAGTMDAGLPAHDAGKEPLLLVAAINSGGGAYTSVDGLEYTADAYFTESRTDDAEARDDAGARGIALDVAGSDDDALYATARWDDDFRYAIPVENGTYRILLQFAETYWNEPGQRVFDVEVEGERVLDDLDLVNEVGADTALEQSLEIRVDDGNLTVRLFSSVDMAVIHGLVLWRLPADAAR